MSQYINVPKIILDSISELNSECIKVYLLLCSEQNTLSININNEEIASKLRLPKNIIPKYLKELEQKGLIKLHSGHIEIITHPRESVSDNDVMELFSNIETVWKKPLSPSDADRLLFLIQDLHISKELIIYIINVCAGKGIYNINYCEKVILDLHEKSINTVEQAKQKFSANNNFQQRDYDFKALEGQIVDNQ